MGNINQIRAAFKVLYIQMIKLTDEAGVTLVNSVLIRGI